MISKDCFYDMYYNTYQTNSSGWPTNWKTYTDVLEGCKGVTAKRSDGKKM